MFYSETICSFYFERFLMYLYGIVIVILYCPLKRFSFIEIFNWDLEKVSIVRRCVRRKEVSAIEDVLF